MIDLFLNTDGYMLILTRRPGERIFLNPGTPDEIIIAALEVNRHGQMRIGIVAPRTVEILREELLPPGFCGMLPKEKPVADRIDDRH